MSDQIEGLIDLAQQAHWLKQHLADGGIFAYPTESVYGIGGDPSNAQTIESIIAIKGRAQEKGLIIVAGNWAQLTGFIAPLSLQEKKEIEHLSLVRPTTVIVEKGENTHPLACDSITGRIAFRISYHPLIQKLCALFKQPILSTSANPAGKHPAKTAQEVRAYFPHLPIIRGDLGGNAQVSRIIDWQDKMVLRK